MNLIFKQKKHSQIFLQHVAKEELNIPKKFNK